MNYIDDWSLYNQKNRLKAKEFVNDNLFRLITFFNFEEESSEEERAQLLLSLIHI